MQKTNGRNERSTDAPSRDIGDPSSTHQTVEQGLSQRWAGAAAFESRAGGSTSQRIPTAEWPAFCEWFSRNFQGTEAGMERTEGNGNRVVEFQSRPLMGMQSYLLANDVSAIGLIFRANNHTRLFTITGVNAIQLELDAAGFPIRLELLCDGEKAVLHFTGSVQTRPIYSGNGWGE